MLIRKALNFTRWQAEAGLHSVKNLLSPSPLKYYIIQNLKSQSKKFNINKKNENLLKTLCINPTEQGLRNSFCKLS